MSLPGLVSVHHIAIICSDYETSKAFYSDILGGHILAETFREARNSYKLDIEFPGFQIELFSFPNPPSRPSRPEAQGLRHLALAVEDLNRSIEFLEKAGIAVEPVRIDELTNNRFTFFQDPDGLPLELVEIGN